MYIIILYYNKEKDEIKLDKNELKHIINLR